MPLDHDEAGEKPAAPKALVRIIDRDHEKQSGTALLRQLDNFTSTEFEIAVRLAPGEDLKQISDELTVSVWTVRTHLHHVFDNTDTHRQAELVRHLLAVTP
jgi:DNA-binding NarL/FixJ family response regulator